MSIETVEETKPAPSYFEGRSISLIGINLLTFFVCIITIGIFTLWLPIKYQKRETKHVEIDCKVEK